MLFKKKKKKCYGYKYANFLAVNYSKTVLDHARVFTGLKHPFVQPSQNKSKCFGTEIKILALVRCIVSSTYCVSS